MADGGDSGIPIHYHQSFNKYMPDRKAIEVMCVSTCGTTSFVGVFSFVYINILYDFYGVVKETGLAE